MILVRNFFYVNPDINPESGFLVEEPVGQVASLR